MPNPTPEMILEEPPALNLVTVFPFRRDEFPATLILGINGHRAPGPGPAVEEKERVPERKEWA